MKLWPIPQDLDDDISMILSAEHKEKEGYKYDIVKLTFRNRHNGQQHKAIQLISMAVGERRIRENPKKWLMENIWSNPIEALYQDARRWQ